MKKILILKDHCGYTATSLKSGINRSINIQRLAEQLQNKGFNVEISSLHNISDSNKEKGVFVFYPSSEDQGLFYKGYIEDVLLDLLNRGLILLPEFKYFRAHHDKSFMEMLRSESSEGELKSIKSATIYDERDLLDSISGIEKTIAYPMVIKTSEGSGASGVRLAHNRNELIKNIRRMGYVKYHNSTTPWWKTVALSKMKTKFLKVTGKPFIERTYPREKLVIQNYIPNLKYDYKVLVYWDKYFVLKRLTRDNDFRASGSGKLIFPSEFNDEIRKVLDLARKAFLSFKVPMLSIDVAYDGEFAHMIEFQCVSFGPYTAQFAKRYYKYNGDTWEAVERDIVLEDEIADSLSNYIEEYYHE